MFNKIRIALATRAHIAAMRRRVAYNNAANRDWNVLIAMALANAECKAANRVAALIDPAFPLRAF